MDDRWRRVKCGCIGGMVVGVEPPGEECNCWDGWLYVRPKGHLFAYPGGPALGMAGEDYYERGEPVTDDWFN
jgi:hypothetical protein